MKSHELIGAILAIDNQEKAIDRCREELEKAEEELSNAVHNLRSLVRIDPKREVVIAGKYAIGYVPDRDSFEIQCTEYVKADDPEDGIGTAVDRFHKAFDESAMLPNAQGKLQELFLELHESIRSIVPNYDERLPILINGKICYNFDQMDFRTAIFAE